MQKIIPLAVVLILWATSVIGSDLPPYSASYELFPLFIAESTNQPEKNIEIYPNPVTEDRLTIKSSDYFLSIQILNITGEIVFNREYPSGSTSEIIELGKLQKGIYLIRLEFSGKVNHTEKIMVK